MHDISDRYWTYAGFSLGTKMIILFVMLKPLKIGNIWPMSPAILFVFSHRTPSITAYVNEINVRPDATLE